MTHYTFQDAEASIKEVLPEYKATLARALPLVKAGKLPLVTVALVTVAEKTAGKIAEDAEAADALPDFAAGDLHDKIVCGAQFLGKVLSVLRDGIMLAEIPEDALPC